MQRRIFRTISPIDAVGSAANSERNLAGFISAIGGVVLASDALYASPLRARLKLFLIDCNGHVTWHTYTTSNKVHNGTNVASGTTQLAENALRDSKDQPHGGRPNTNSLVARRFPRFLRFWQGPGRPGHP